MIGSLAEFTTRLLNWYDAHRRDLPWRVSEDRPGPLDPYHVLLSETMLQQTQVATVIPYFRRFIERLPTLADLAAAPEQEVLRLWQGLGYYSRARNLRSAAQKIVADLGGRIPSKVIDLQELPGIGRYTAGAVASIAFGEPAPVLDGNVMRVLCRIDGIENDPREKQTHEKLWQRAQDLVPAARPGDFNSALMELGATVCRPRNPQCLLCPVRRHCRAAADDTQDRIPPARETRPTPLYRRYIYCIRRRGRWLLEQRPETGRWAGMWQFVTIETPDPNLLPVQVREPRPVGRFSHQLTHRRYQFHVFIADAISAQTRDTGRTRKWVRVCDLDRYPLPRPHILALQSVLKGGV
jgi:A/G-specific adenine glycosylase